MLWFACSVDVPSATERPTDGLETTSPDSDPSSTPTDESPPVSPPPVDEAMDEFCPNPRPGELFPEGDDLARVTLSGAGRCNDGSEPVLYVRAATDPKHADDWVWRFGGGGFCSSTESCAARWCGTNFPYGNRHMSSLGYPTAIGGIGISSDLEENTFRGWNQVFAAYCTSDGWIGSRSDVVLGGEPAFVIHFDGAKVARDGIAAAVTGLRTDDGAVQLRSLAAAANIVVAGTSAGCQGAAAHSAAFTAAAEDAVVTTVLESCFDAAPEVPDADFSRALDANLARFADEVAQGVWGADPDPACAADHPTDAWRCFGFDVRVRDYLPRVFLHHDLADPVVFDTYSDVGMGRYDYSAAAIATFRLYEEQLPQISIHAPTCYEHTAIDETVPFLFMTVVDGEKGGPPISFHDALVAALSGRPIVAVDALPSTGSVCPR